VRTFDLHKLERRKEVKGRGCRWYTKNGKIDKENSRAQGGKRKGGKKTRKKGNQERLCCCKPRNGLEVKKSTKDLGRRGTRTTPTGGFKLKGREKGSPRT